MVLDALRRNRNIRIVDVKMSRLHLGRMLFVALLAEAS